MRSSSLTRMNSARVCSSITEDCGDRWPSTCVINRAIALRTFRSAARSWSWIVSRRYTRLPVTGSSPPYTDTRNALPRRSIRPRWHLPGSNKDRLEGTRTLSHANDRNASRL